MDTFISKIPNTQPEIIVQMEVTVLAACNFRPPQFSVVPCLYGFILDIIPIIGKISNYQEITQKALDRLQISFMIEDIILLESPSHIALACILDSDSDDVFEP